MSATVVPLHRSESLSDRVAARVRGLAREYEFENQQIAHALGLTPAAITRRMQGRLPFKVDELQLIADLFGVHFATLIPGAQPERDEAPPERGFEVVRRQGLEPRTRWLGRDSDLMATDDELSVWRRDHPRRDHPGRRRDTDRTDDRRVPRSPISPLPLTPIAQIAR